MKTYDIQNDRSRELQFRFGFHELAQVVSLVNVLLDQPTILVHTMFLERLFTLPYPGDLRLGIHH